MGVGGLSSDFSDFVGSVFWLIRGIRVRGAGCGPSFMNVTTACVVCVADRLTLTGFTLTTFVRLVRVATGLSLPI
jgi:hypothetical protein